MFFIVATKGVWRNLGRGFTQNPNPRTQDKNLSARPYDLYETRGNPFRLESQQPFGPLRA